MAKGGTTNARNMYTRATRLRGLLPLSDDTRGGGGLGQENAPSDPRVEHRRCDKGAKRSRMRHRDNWTTRARSDYEPVRRERSTVAWRRGAHSWYHFLSLYFSISWCAEEENSEAWECIRSARSSSCDSLSPRSTTIWCARDTSLQAAPARAPRASIPAGPGMCLATARLGLPLLSPTETPAITLE